MNRPTEDILDDMDPADTGACGCLMPSPDVTEDTEEGEADE